LSITGERQYDRVGITPYMSPDQWFEVGGVLRIKEGTCTTTMTTIPNTLPYCIQTLTRHSRIKDNHS